MARPDSKILNTDAQPPAEETVVKQRKAPRAPTPEQQAKMPGGTSEQLAKAKLEAQEAKIGEPIGKKGLIKLNGRHPPALSKADIKQRTLEIKKVLSVSRGPLTELEGEIAKLQKERAVADKEHGKAVTAHNKKLAVVDKQIEKLRKKADKFSAAYAKTQAKADNQIAAMTGP